VLVVADVTKTGAIKARAKKTKRVVSADLYTRNLEFYPRVIRKGHRSGEAAYLYIYIYINREASYH
jgi:hypothetical protein